jgi:hypothetical protein
LYTFVKLRLCAIHHPRQGTCRLYYHAAVALRHRNDPVIKSRMVGKEGGTARAGVTIAHRWIDSPARQDHIRHEYGTSLHHDLYPGDYLKYVVSFPTLPIPGFSHHAYPPCESHILHGRPYSSETLTGSSFSHGSSHPYLRKNRSHTRTAPIRVSDPRRHPLNAHINRNSSSLLVLSKIL